MSKKVAYGLIIDHAVLNAVLVRFSWVIDSFGDFFKHISVDFGWDPLSNYYDGDVRYAAA